MVHLTDLKNSTISMGFTIDEVTGAVNKAGLTVKNVYNAFTKDMPDDKSERLYFVIEK